MHQKIERRTVSYWLGYAVGYWQRRIRPRLPLQYWLGYFAGRRANKQELNRGKD
jgi:hypothetical protein